MPRAQSDRLAAHRAGGRTAANAIALRVPRRGRQFASGAIRFGLAHGRGAWRSGGWPQWENRRRSWSCSRGSGSGMGAPPSCELRPRNEAQPHLFREIVRAFEAAGVEFTEGGGGSSKGLMRPALLSDAIRRVPPCASIPAPRRNFRFRAELQLGLVACDPARPWPGRPVIQFPWRSGCACRHGGDRSTGVNQRHLNPRGSKPC